VRNDRWCANPDALSNRKFGSATVGCLALAVFWDGQTHLLFEEGAIGAIVSLAFLVVAIIFPQAFDWEARDFTAKLGNISQLG
jgi:uncharacterized YccA/Bax inhibitor family protein